MKVCPDTSENDPSCPPEALNHTAQGRKDMAGISDDYKHLFFHSHLQNELPSFCRSASQSGSKCRGTECMQVSDGLCNGSSENVVSNCGMMEIEDSRSSPYACSFNTVDDDDGDDDDDEDLTPEVQQAYRIFHSFLTDKHKVLTAPFWCPIGPGERGGNAVSFNRIDGKFVNREYESITEFVADFRLMLENCYRFHGVDHWISKQAQKLEIILEQKLTLLSRTLREKTTLAVTSGGRFGTEDEKGPAGTSTRRRSVPRNLAAITVGGCESIMVQALRLEEQQRAKEEKRQRELEKKEAEEASAKEVEEWEQCLLSLAEPWPISTMWELPAIGHFLCLAQTTLNLPEIVFFELERCLLMPRCSSFLAKVMTSLLCQPHRRATLHRRPSLPYRRWEAELRQKVLGWYKEVGQAEDQVARAEQLGLCHQFFWTLGETSPLDSTAFHLLPFNQRVWLLKGLCDNVYETQKDVQNAVLGQPIHECRESILGYDSQENAYIHFPHFCGADLRIYRQSPCAALSFPLPPFHVKKLECEVDTRGASGISAVMPNYLEHIGVKEENEDSTSGDLELWINEDDSLRDMDVSSVESEPDQKGPKRFLFPHKEELPSPESIKGEPLKVKLKEQKDKNEVAEEVSDCEPCLTVGENCYKGKLPANFPSTDTLQPSLQFIENATQKNGPPRRDKGPCPKCSMDSDGKREHRSCFCFKAEADRTGSVFSRQASRSGAETGRMRSKKKKRKKKKEKSIGVKAGTGKLGLKTFRHARAARGTLHKAAIATMKRNDKRKKRKLGRKFDSKKAGEKETEPPQLPLEPTFKLVCTSLDELRDLISKTEDELDELESSKKRCGRWYLKRESVKELHITLIRLLNELLPWEPKLLKAFQRNRGRLKKESDDFKKHPEYENFVREECMAVEGDGGACKKGSSAETSREDEDEDRIERTLKGDSGVTECENQHGTESLGCLIRGQEIFTSLSESGPLTQGLKHRQNCDLDEGFSPSKRGKFVDDYVISEPQFEVACHNSSRANPLTTERAPAITAPVGTFQRHCKPIQALLAKSVGNKVTLMSHPQATAMAQALGLPNKIETLAVSPTKPTTSCPLTPLTAPVTTQTQMPITSSAPVQVVCNVSDGLSLVRKDCTPLKFSMQPVMDQKTEEKLMQQIIILPSNLLIQNEETRTQQPSITSTTVLSNTIGFTVPENKIPVQQVAPLKDTSIVKTPSPSVSPSLLKLTSCRASPSPKKTTEPHSMLNRSPTPILSSAHPNKCDGKQELKTMCIRDSQSILVTTRGGNTGVVKVQTSEQSGAGSLPSSPVFTMPPQFQAFLVSKTSAMATSTAQAQIATTTAKLLPIISSPNDKGNSLKSSPQSPLKRVGAVNPSLLVESTCGAVTFSTGSPIPVTSVLDSHAKTAQTLISVNSLLTAPSQSNVSSTVKSVQGIPHTTTFNSTLQSPLKRCQARSLGPEQSTFPKVFLVTPTTNNPASTANVTTAPAPSTVSGSRVLFMSQSSSACSTVTIPKGPITSVSSTAAATSLPVEGMKVRPNFVHATGSTTTGTLTKVQGINISGLTARIVDEKTVTSNSLVPLTDAATKVASVTVSSVLATSSSGLIFVQKSNPAATTCPSMSIKGPVKATGATDGKTVTFSTYGSGHMASSALLSAVDQKNMSSTVSISNILNTKSEQVIGSLAPNLASLSSGSLINKDSTLPGGLMNDKPWVTTSLTTASSPIKLPTSVPRVSHPLTLTTTAATHTSGTTSPAPQPGLTSVVRAPINPISSNTAVQEKVVINTNAPLAPGTQLLINNMKFVVPAQGLGPGSHVLFISSPAMRPAGPLGTSPLPLVPRGAGTSNLLSPTPVVQGPRMVAPVMQSHHTPVRLPVCTTSVPFHQPLTTARPPLSSTDSTAFAQITQLGMVMSPGQQSLTNIVRLPSSSAPEGKGHSVVPSHREPNCRKKEVVAVAAQSQRSSQNMATPALVQTGLVSAPSKPQLTSVLSPVISRTPPMLTMPPMSSTISRMHTLPVATVPPIGGTISSCQATPIATIPPSVNTVIMAGRGVQPGNMRMPVVITNTSQVQGKAPVQVPGAHTIHTPSKLLLSPDGAILNVVRCPALQNVPVMANTMTAQVVVPTCSGVTGPDMNTLDSQRMLTVNPERPNH
ncbi:uncharacterized protein KIAA2026 isoform X1 [Pygocentrus nattereri]|uniref:Bromo domain-containing protein n=1 Tax=Pygocentrus nattereri TaxID=42514 RepID=A0AAR2K064_PYGNA|nr:uncharacterized protein KIAA2026 isoform X1 [Pygocentrus nattereri]